MWFDDKEKLVKDITSSDIESLVIDQVAENENIDFKIEPYGGTNANGDKKFELCCDVASFANAGGGYIVIGIRDRDDKAVEWAPIPNPEQHIERIHKTCLDGIEPRIPDLDIGAVSVVGQGKVIVIRIPEGARKPYMVCHSRKTHFCCRYADGKREMSCVEIRESFRSDWTDQRMTRIEAKVDSVMERLSLARPPALTAETDALTVSSPEELDYVMEERLRRFAEE